ncbi:hypothetical protein RRG08_012773 [Elysia crispata]|uniref:Uncharacterized protein n=1 Tax=Elysia crispata TaxID=231223 RepID=A0AAE1D3W3_9GAST|nr:hypothetical protein RRG08_012773 [Elysia crispata]
MQPSRLTSFTFRAPGCLRNSATLGSLSCSSAIQARSMGGMGDADATIGCSAQGARESTSDFGSGWLRSVAEASEDLAASNAVWHSSVQVITLPLLFVASVNGARSLAIPGRNLW